MVKNIKWMLRCNDFSTADSTQVSRKAPDGEVRRKYMTRVENRLQLGSLVMFTKCDVVTLCKQSTSLELRGGASPIESRRKSDWIPVTRWAAKC